MSRIRLLVFTLAVLLMPSGASAQAFTTPVDQMTLRVVEGNGYTVLTDMAGTPQQGILHQVQAGSFPEAMAPVVIEFYTRTGVRDVYITFVNFIPPGQDPAGEIIATAVEMRVAIFATEEGAATYVNDFAQEFPRQAEALGTNPDITPLEDLPGYNGAIFGYTTTEPYNDVETGAPSGEVSSTRILAQQGTAIASAKVSGLDIELNGRQALELALTQAECIAQDAPCEPTAIPVEFPLSDALALTEDAAATPGEGDAAGAESGEADVAGNDSTRTATVVAQTANIRAEASASAPVVAVAASGETMTVTGEGIAADGYTWLPVTTGAGVQGWIADSLVTLSD